MGILVTNLLEGFHIEVTSVEGTIHLYPKSSVMKLTVSPDVDVPLAQQNTYGVVKGSSSISITDGVPVLNMTYFNTITQDFATKAWVQAGAFATQDYVNNAIANLNLGGGGGGTGTSWLEDYFTLVKPNALDSSTWYLRASKSLVSVGEIMAYAFDESLPSIWDSMPIASETTLGGVKIGPTSGINIAGDGTITVTGIGGEGGVTDHGALTGLADDDHPQYLNTARGNALYSPISHTHIIANITGLQSALDSKQNVSDLQFELRTDGLGNQYLYTALPVVSAKEITAYSSDSPTIPSIWTDMPIATGTTLGGVIVGTGLLITPQGVLTVDGDIFNLSNYYTKAESDAKYALAGSGQFEVRTDINGVEYLYTARPIVSNAEITAYGSPDAVVPSLWDSIPIASTGSLGRVRVDGTTIVIDAEGIISAVVGTGGGTLLTLNGTTLYIGESGSSSVDLTPAVTSLITGKQDTITGAASSIVANNLSANKVVISDGSGKIAASAVSSQKIVDLDGMFELVPNSGNPYIRAKYNFVGDYDIMAFGDSGGLPSSIWDSLPTASGTVKGGVKIGAGLSIDVNGVLSANIPGSQTLSFSNPYLSLSGGNTVDLSSLTPNLSAYATQTWVFQNYEPKITKSTGYLKWTGSQWLFLNESYISATHTINGISNGTGFLKNNGAGLWTYDSNVYATSTSLTNHINDSVKHITSTERSNWNTAYTNNHTHSNKALLNSYTQTEANLADAVSKKHSHANIAYLDVINQSLTKTSDVEFNALLLPINYALNVGGIYSKYFNYGETQNFLQYTEEHNNNSYWSRTNISAATANTTVAPNGTTTADTITGSSSAGEINQNTTGVTDSNATGNFTFSVWLKTASGTATVNLRIDSSAETGTGKDCTVTTEWRRFYVTQNFATTNSYKVVRIKMGATSVIVWGSQLEQGTVPTTYSGTITTNYINTATPLFNTTGSINHYLPDNALMTLYNSDVNNNRLQIAVAASNGAYDGDALTGDVIFRKMGGVSRKIIITNGHAKSTSADAKIALKAHTTTDGTGLYVHNNGTVSIGSSTAPASTETLKVTGNIVATAEVTAYSDERIKKNIKSSQDVLNKVNEIRVVDYELVEDMTHKKRIGVIAQELLAIFPEFVSGSREDYFSVNYAQLSAIALKAIQELSDKVNEQEERIKMLEEKLNQLIK